MLQPSEFYQLLEEFYASKKRTEPLFRLGTVDLAYTSGLPKVKLDGDDTVTAKEYSHIRNYSPKAGDRVMLALVGNTYIIIGRLRNDPLQSPDTGGGGGGSTSVTWSDVTGKPSTFPPSTHSHAISDVTGLQTALDGKSSISHTHAWGDITGKPTTFTPTAHSHAIADVTNLQTTLDGKANTSHTHVLANITDFPTQTGNAGKFLQTNGTSLSWVASSTSVDWSAITGKPSAFPPSAHTHTISDVTDLQTTLDGKASTSHSHLWADITSKPWTVSGFDLTQDYGNYKMGSSTGSVYAYAYRPRADADNLLIRSDSEIRAYRASSTAYTPIRASSFPTGSSINYKTNIEDLSSRYDALGMIKGLRAKHYHIQSNVDAGIFDKPKVGFIAEMVDPIFRDEDGVDIYTITAMNVEATQQLDKRIADLELTVEKQAEMIEVLLSIIEGGGSS